MNLYLKSNSKAADMVATSVAVAGTLAMAVVIPCMWILLPIFGKETAANHLFWAWVIVYVLEEIFPTVVWITKPNSLSLAEKILATLVGGFLGGTPVAIGILVANVLFKEKDKANS